MLIGSYCHHADAKGRLFIPAKWRDELSERFILTRGTDQCIFCMPMKEWKRLSEKLSELPLTSREAQAVNRLFSRWATDCVLDKQGRVLVPQNLRAFAKMETNTTLIGVTTHIEIWNTSVLNEQDERADNGGEDIMEKAAGWGI